jgi:hypothetical protein
LPVGQISRTSRLKNMGRSRFRVSRAAPRVPDHNHFRSRNKSATSAFAVDIIVRRGDRLIPAGQPDNSSRVCITHVVDAPATFSSFAFEAIPGTEGTGKGG